MKIIGETPKGDLIAIEFSGIEMERYDKDEAEKCHLFLRGYNYQFFYAIFKLNPGQEKYATMTNEEAKKIIEKAITNEFVDLREMGQFVIVYHERWETVYIRNDINEFDDEDIPVLISVSKE